MQKSITLLKTNGIVLLLIVFTINYFLFGNNYWGSFRSLLLLSGISGSLILVGFYILSSGNRFIGNQYPVAQFFSKRITATLVFSFIVIQLLLVILFYGYDYLDLFNYKMNLGLYVQCAFIAILITSFYTFINEGLWGFQQWKFIASKTEEQKKLLVKSQLFGLKSQIDSHFLFNSLNTLSSLINENIGSAEAFLNEIVKVYRYLLNNEEQLVPLVRELKYIKSYFYILEQRYGSGIQLNIDVKEEQLQKYLPSLTFQMILEDVINTNCITKSEPLMVSIATISDHVIKIKSNVQKKHSLTQTYGGIETLKNKYCLLGNRRIIINEDSLFRIIHLPVFDTKEASL